MSNQVLKEFRMDFENYARLCDIVSNICESIAEIKTFNFELHNEEKDYKLDYLIRVIDSKSDDLLNACIDEQQYLGNIISKK